MLQTTAESIGLIAIGIVATLGAIFFLNVIWRTTGSGWQNLKNAQKYSIDRSGSTAGATDVIFGRIDSGRNSKPDFAVQRSMTFSKDGEIIPQGRLADEVIDNVTRK